MNPNEYRILWNEVIRFVDDFRRNPNLEKIQKPPTYSNNVAQAFYAGVVEELTKEQNMNTPMWVFSPKYYLQNPVFLGGLKGIYRIFIMLETPLSFKARNIFIGANTFDRC